MSRRVIPSSLLYKFLQLNKGLQKTIHHPLIFQERLRAATIGYEDPINPSYESTTAMYEKVLTEMMQQILTRDTGKVAVMVASHNEETVRFTLKKYVGFRIL